MNIIVLIIIGSVLIFSAIGYFLFSSFARKANESIYWQKRQTRDKESDQLKKEIYLSELELKTNEELIKHTVACRNLIQKISIEVNNLLNQQSANNPIQTLEIHFLLIFQKDVDRVINHLNNFKTNRETKLSEVTANYLNQLIEWISDVKATIRKTINAISDHKINTGKLTELNQQITDNYSQIVDMHKWIISHFQKVFAEIQPTDL